MSMNVIAEAQRCLQCTVPMCQKGCPINTPIPKVIGLMLEGKLNEAGRVLFENNPLTSVCPLVCNHENQCEGHCVLGRKGMPVHFSEIESYISSNYSSRVDEGPAPSNGMRVAIIGSGPAGLTIAVILARKGYQVTIFEGRDKIGGVLRYSVPEFRLPRKVIDDFEYHHLVLKNIRVRPNTTIGGAITIENMFEDGYKAIFLGTGMWKPNTLHIKGETLGNVHFGINYLNNPDSYRLGESINILGTGKVAMDVARTALRKGVKKVTCFSQTRKIDATKRQYEYAVLEGVQFLYNKKPVELVDEGVVCDDVAEYEDGTFEKIPGMRKLYPADSTIICASQGAKSQLVNTTAGLRGDQHGLLIADEYGRTSRPGIFAAGDAAAVAYTVVEAAAHSKMVAEAMDAYMQGYDLEKKLRGFIK